MWSEFYSRHLSIACAFDQVVNIMFDQHQQKKKKRHDHQLSTKVYPYNQIEDENKEYKENQQYHKCSNSLCQIIENNVSDR
ncbi:unnamed protein product [Rotaria sp. Silwood2]|nr:unnamed protein product [Rotaria sp. Silwood2]CAF3118349.1 unnamed protein product [Rotaria sp. Silwood2]CAF4169175.1 unnamed protein product [Rotaria sp. Silwood2]CAF4564917.1 unnamed protein product [Rotaria sp. Silwood2]